MTPRRTVTVGVRVDAIPAHDCVLRLIDQSLERGDRMLMTFANPGTAVTARRNPDVARMFEAFDLVAPDGIGMVRAIQWVHRLPATRISFDSTSLAPLVMRLAAERHLAIVICGGQPGIAEQAGHKLAEAFGGLNIVATYDGYTAPQEQTIDAINKLRPQIVICGMGTIRQEAFLLALAASGWTGLGFTCGGYLDQLCQSGLNYYPRVVDALNLRWAYRLAMEPRRLWRRYLVDYPVFAAGLCRALLSSPPDPRAQK